MTKTVSAHELLNDPKRDQPVSTRVNTIIGWRVSAPGNLGAMLRLAANFACGRVLFVEPPGVKHNQRLIKKTAVAAPQHVEWSFVTPEVFAQNWAHQWPIVGVETSADSVDLAEVAWPDDCAVMVGSEKLGMTAEALDHCRQVVHIASPGPIHSLNVSHALAIVLYDAAVRNVSSLP